MRNTRLKYISLATCLAFSEADAQQVVLDSIAYQSTPRQAVIDLSIVPTETPENRKTPEFKAFLIDNPPRLVLDVKNLKPSAPLSQPSTDHPYFQRLRSSPRNKNDLRLVFDLKNQTDIHGYTIDIESTAHGSSLITLTDESTLTREQNPNTFEPSNYAHSNSELHKYDLTAPQQSTNDLYPGNFKENRIGASGDESFFNDLISDWEISGYAEVESLGFFQTPQDNQQHSHYISGAINPEIYRSWDNGSQSFAFSPFYRYSQHDSRRTHFDIRELTWLKAAYDWELRVGFRQVFWGVTEGFHLIDIINQADFVENIDGEQKLGQPMINLALIQDWGTIDLFLLTGFRERTFAGHEGRLRTHPVTSVGDAQFEREGVEKHLAYAGRYSHSFGDWDVGLAHFYGTARQPTMLPRFNQLGEIERIIPLYENINQTSIDVQTIKGSWLWKLEALMRSGQGDRFYAATGGVEYTFFDLFESGVDLGLITEYMYDSRGYNNFQALTQQALFQDDFLAAVRLGFNDIQNTQLLAGVIFDRTQNSKIYNIEASRRIGNDWTADLQVRLFRGIPVTDPLIMFSADDHVRFQLKYHF
ncbi:MAG: AMIN domain-containing protein [Gammaproteobacteria bacterium]|nr:AMIN domain-containing protein [Gammaproteobacteria bacterium]